MAKMSFLVLSTHNNNKLKSENNFRQQSSNSRLFVASESLNVHKFTVILTKTHSQLYNR